MTIALYGPLLILVAIMPIPGSIFSHQLSPAPFFNRATRRNLQLLPLIVPVLLGHFPLTYGAIGVTINSRDYLVTASFFIPVPDPWLSRHWERVCMANRSPVG